MEYIIDPNFVEVIDENSDLEESEKTVADILIEEYERIFNESKEKEK